ncbi:MAG: hypothetical protein D6806_17445, partial [Deltaproteobacteria bacterium]
VSAWNCPNPPHWRSDCDWDVSRDSSGNPIPWFDMKDYGLDPRPITNTPAIAMNEKRNLVLFFGTGRIDDLTYHDTQDYLFAVEEWRKNNSNDYLLPCGKGVLYCSNSTMSTGQCPEEMAGMHSTICSSDAIKTLLTAERAYGKPLVAYGKVFFSTFQPSGNLCDAGTGRLRVFKYDDFSAEALTNNTLENKGPPRSPKMVWTQRGPQVVTGQGGKLQVIKTAEGGYSTGAQVVFWGKVL